PTPSKVLTEVSGLSAAVLIRAIARRGLLIRDHPADGLLGNPEVLSGGLEIDVGLKLISHTNTSFKVRGRRPTRPIFRTARGGARRTVYSNWTTLSARTTFLSRANTLFDSQPSRCLHRTRTALAFSHSSSHPCRGAPDQQRPHPPLKSLSVPQRTRSGTR